MQSSRSCARLLLTALIAGAGFCGGPAAHGAPSMVADLYTSKAGLSLPPRPSNGVEHDGVQYFPAVDVQHGDELWRTDGSAAGTFRLTDVCPGACSSDVVPLDFYRGQLYFIANDGERGKDLWRTDGRPGGERRVPGVCDSACLEQIRYARTWRGALWFLEVGADHTPVLWTSDLTAAGTHAVADLYTDLGICGFDQNSGAFLYGTDPSGDALLLSVQTDARYLYRTDGTSQGTMLLHRFGSVTLTGAGLDGAPVAARPGPVRRSATASGPEPLFFLDGEDLWVTDGTVAGTRFVRSIEEFHNSFSTLGSSEVVDGVWYGIFSFGEWIRSDGTAGGTLKLATLPPGVFESQVARLGSAVFAITNRGVWRAGTTPETTAKIADWVVEDVLTVVEQPQRLFLLVWLNGGTLWTTDGTAEGTRHVHLPAGAPADQYEMIGFADGALFTRGSDQLWMVDPSGVRARQLHDFQPADGPSLMPGSEFLGDRLLFFARTDFARARLFASDGTSAGTEVISAVADELVYIDYLPFGHMFSRFGRQVLFTSDFRPFVTDGSARGTRRLTRGSSFQALDRFVPIAAFPDRALFAGHVRGGPSCDPGEIEPWITSGLPRDTHRLVDLNPFFYDGGGSQCEGLPMSSNPGPGLAFGSVILFPSDDLVHGRELFATDGTARGTRLLADINPGTVPNDVTDPPGVPARMGVGSSPSDFARLGGRVLFAADDGSAGRELWVTNATPAGTHRVVDLVAGPEGSSPHDLVVFRGAVYFIARHGDGDGLFRSDGTAAGTSLVSDLELGGLPTRARELVVAGQRLFFVGMNETTGTELWTSQGSATDTRLVADLRRGARGSSPQHLAAIGGVLLFAADDGRTGLEPWRSDGTVAGTRSVGDLAAGTASSNPGPFTLVGECVLFGADDGMHGRELWEIPVAEVRRSSPPR